MPEPLTPFSTVFPPDSVVDFDVESPHGAPVYAAGIDLVDVDRLGLAMRRSGPRLLHRLFDERERMACAEGSDPVGMAHLFGIKESVVKVIGGLPRGASYRDVVIDVDGPDGTGSFPVRLAGPLADWRSAHPTGAITGGGTATDHGIVVSWALALGRGTAC